MVVPSVEAAKITVQLLENYKDEEELEKAVPLKYNYEAPEEFLREHFEQQYYTEDLQDDVAELFFKILKYRKFLGIIETEILRERSSLPGERPVEATEPSPINIVFLYLFLFELNEFTINEVKELISSINKEKALMLLTSLKKTETVTKLYELGTKFWDIEYVKEVLKNVFQKQLLEEVSETFTNQEKKAKRFQKKLLTVPVGPRCLNDPKKYAPAPEIVIAESTSRVTRIPVLIKANPVPASTYLRQSNSVNLQKAFEKNHTEGRRKYEEAQKNAFKCATTEKSEKFRRIVEQIEMERSNIPVKKPSFNKIKFGERQPPKKTAAVILREGARLLKIEQEEIKRYEDLARGGFNNDQLEEWQKEIREETIRKRVEDMEKKHLEVLLAYEEALISKQKYLKKKKERAAEFRKEKENWLIELEMLRREEQMRIQESCERGKAIGKGAKEAVEQIKEEKHRIALEAMEESRALKERWLREKEEDLQRKVQLIKEIKALQAFGVVRRKHAISNEPVSLGFLYEMSSAELKERLFIMKMELQEDLQRRRAEVKMKRECRKEIIDTYQELIESHQKILEEQKQRSEVDVRDEEMKNKTRLTRTSSSLDCLRRKLYEKRSERIKHQIMC